MTRDEIAKLQVRRANLQEWIALLEAGRWPGDRVQVCRGAALEHYRLALELVELHLNNEASPVELLRHPLEISARTSPTDD